ncbi:hypothetical protein E0H26_19145 [Micromonospora zingiberis]|uniref:Uncharacterized protein n=1 Tax=Micromonospora zingiberis TaxID=2053011 RepID=A0A4R0GEB7_9ACTN|nr:hypothetical protein [Micromonospora zingiberis]TCB95580.1 hypothetical protein E0H26_19145 [Micromonospora zingiberis]
MSIGEVKAALSAAVNAARAGQGVFDRAVAKAEAATTAAEAVFHGSRHEEVAATRQALVAARAEVEPTRRRFDATMHRTAEYLTRLG